MIVLDTSTKSLVIKIGGAKTTNELDWTCSYVSDTTSQCNTGTQPAPINTNQSTDGTTNGSTYVTMAGPPPADDPANTGGLNYDIRILYISVNNTDTVPQTITIALNDGGTYRVLFKATIAVGTNVIYNSFNE